MPRHEEKRPELFVVGVSIGNPDDVSPRARQTLESVDLIAAEDTRKSGMLLKTLGIKHPPFLSYYDHKEDKIAQQLINRLVDESLRIALISDAGTPCISDPGYKLIDGAKKAGIRVTPIPGPSAPITLASVSGLPTDRFSFVGFLPRKDGALTDEIQSWLNLRGSILCFESALRLSGTLEKIAEKFPEARISIGRELTKKFEEIVTLPVDGAREFVAKKEKLRGEVTLMIDLTLQKKREPVEDNQELAGKIRLCRKYGMSHKEIMRLFSDAAVDRKTLYKLTLATDKETST